MAADLDRAAEAAGHFTASDQRPAVREIGSGNINDTFLVTDGQQGRFILQRLSRHAFSQPQRICANLATLGRYLPAAQVGNLVDRRRWHLPQLITTTDQQLCWCDADQTCWRAITYIDEATTLTALENDRQAREVGRALAIFHTLVAEIPATKLQVTIPHFHDTPHYLRLYDAALAARQDEATQERSQHYQEVIARHRHLAPLLSNALAAGRLTLTISHGDPKLANILFDRATGRACALIDLDTVGPGLLVHDLADCLRSCCNRGDNRFDLDICCHILTGYLDYGCHLLTDGDKEYLPQAIRVLPFELGLRFVTDYLSGSRYFKTSGPAATLQRGLDQFQLLASIETQRELLTELIDRLLAG